MDSHDHDDQFLTIDDLREPCCGPHMICEDPRVIVSFCEERGWRVFLNERLLCRIVTEDSEYGDILDMDDPNANATDEDDQPCAEPLESSLIFAIQDAVARFIQEPGNPLGAA